MTSRRKSASDELSGEEFDYWYRQGAASAKHDPANSAALDRLVIWYREFLRQEAKKVAL